MCPELCSCRSNPEHAGEEGTLLKEVWNVYILRKLREIPADVSNVLPGVVTKGTQVILLCLKVKEKLERILLIWTSALVICPFVWLMSTTAIIDCRQQELFLVG